MKSTCYLCFKLKPVIIVKDLDWEIIPQTSIKCCNKCLEVAIGRIAPWQILPANLIDKEALLEKKRAIAIMLVAVFKKNLMLKSKLLRPGKEISV